MKLRCVLCGRVTLHPALMIGYLGQNPVGPKCARRAGLLPQAKKQTLVFFGLSPKRRRDDTTIDLFLEAPC